MKTIRKDDGSIELQAKSGRTRLVTQDLLEDHGSDPAILWARLDFFQMTDPAKLYTLADVNAAQAAHDDVVSKRAAREKQIDDEQAERTRAANSAATDELTKYYGPHPARWLEKISEQQKILGNKAKLLRIISRLEKESTARKFQRRCEGALRKLAKHNPKLPLKGVGSDRRQIPDVEPREHRDILRAAIPANHKCSATTARRAKGYFSFGIFCSPEAEKIVKNIIESAQARAVAT